MEDNTNKVNNTNDVNNINKVNNTNGENNTSNVNTSKKTKKNAKNPLQPIIDAWKKIDSEKRVFYVIVIIIFVFIMNMDSLYKGWVSFRDNGYRFTDEKTPVSSGEEEEETDPNAGKTLTMTCTQVTEDIDYKITVTTSLTYVDSQLKTENNTMTMQAISDTGKSELELRKALYDVTEEAYKQYQGFDVKSELKDNAFTFIVTTNYSQIDAEKINADAAENGGLVSVELEYNQNIDSVKSYYEDKGMTCKK